MPRTPGAWASYVVGSAQGGAERYSLKLDNSGMPSSVVYDTLTSNAQSPGDQSQTTGQAPLHQNPVVIQNSTGAFAVYVQNTVVSGSTVSTLKEVNVATGAKQFGHFAFHLEQPDRVREGAEPAVDGWGGRHRSHFGLHGQCSH